MRFYTRQHRHYRGVDLHVKAMYLCVLDAAGQILLHRNDPATPEAFLQAVAPYRDDLVVGAECMFTWYWLADRSLPSSLRVPRTRCPSPEPAANERAQPRHASDRSAPSAPSRC